MTAVEQMKVIIASAFTNSVRFTLQFTYKFPDMCYNSKLNLCMKQISIFCAFVLMADSNNHYFKTIASIKDQTKLLSILNTYFSAAPLRYITAINAKAKISAQQSCDV